MTNSMLIFLILKVEIDIHNIHLVAVMGKQLVGWGTLASVVVGAVPSGVFLTMVASPLDPNLPGKL